MRWQHTGQPDGLVVDVFGTPLRRTCPWCLAVHEPTLAAKHAATTAMSSSIASQLALDIALHEHTRTCTKRLLTLAGLDP